MLSTYEAGESLRDVVGPLAKIDWQTLKNFDYPLTYYKIKPPNRTATFKIARHGLLPTYKDSYVPVLSFLNIC